MKQLFCTLVLLALVLLAACHDDPAVIAPERVGPPVVYTSFYPTAYFTQRIAGDLVNVVCPLPDDADPIFWVPGADALRAFQGADLVVLNGAGLEKWAATVSLPERRVVRTADGFKDEWITIKAAASHAHGPGAAHSHAGLDGHTWMDPMLARRQAAAIRDALLRLMPESRDALEAGYKALDRDLSALHEQFLGLPIGKQDVLLCSHPAWNYPARRYGWTIVGFEHDGAGLEQLDGKVALWEGEPDAAAAKRLRARSITFDPCEAPGEGDYLSRMRANLDRLKAALEG